MDRKRKSNEDPEYLRRKIRKLESKLVQKPRRRIRIVDSTDSDTSDEVGPRSPLPDTQSLRSSRRSSLRTASHRSDSPRPKTPHRDRTPQALPSQERPRPRSPQPGPSSAPDQPPRQLVEATITSEEDIELDEHILNLLGNAPKPDTILGKSIHKDVARRWQDILNKGLQKEVKEKFSQEYFVPSNCELLVPPILNPEAKAALAEPLVKRDASLMHRQKQLALAVSALAQATDLILKQKSSTQEVLKPISDACRILCDSHFTETKMRRNFVISAVTTNHLKEALINTQRDKYLFGENLSDKLKAAQTVQKSGNTLKNTQRPYNQFNKNNFTAKNKNQKANLNSKTLHRKTWSQSKPDAGRPPRPAQPASRPSARHHATERSRSPPRKSYRR